jgi:hypothetical protein
MMTIFLLIIEQNVSKAILETDGNRPYFDGFYFLPSIYGKAWEGVLLLLYEH